MTSAHLSSMEENRWYIFYRDSFVNVCHNDNIDFQRIFPEDVKTLHAFIENNYPIAIFTTLQNADAITVTFVESALPLLLLTIRHLKQILSHYQDSHPLHLWACNKLEDIDNSCIRIFYELLIQPFFHLSIQESIIQCISEIISISKRCRHQLVKKIKFNADSYSHEHLSCFLTIFHITSTQKNDFKLLTYFTDILIQLSCHENCELTTALANTCMRRGGHTFTCLDFLSKHLFRLSAFLSEFDMTSKLQPRAVNQRYLSAKIATFSIACTFSTFMVRCSKIYAQIAADKSLRATLLIALDLCPEPQRADLARIIPAARQQLVSLAKREESNKLAVDIPEGMTPVKTAFRRIRPSTGARRLASTQGAFIPNSPSPGKNHHHSSCLFAHCCGDAREALSANSSPDLRG